jgi:hypothetical protein
LTRPDIVALVATVFAAALLVAGAVIVVQVAPLSFCHSQVALIAWLASPSGIRAENFGVVMPMRSALVPQRTPLT